MQFILLPAAGRYYQLCKGQSLLLFLLWLMFGFVGHMHMELCPGSGLRLQCQDIFQPDGGGGQPEAAESGCAAHSAEAGGV